MGAVPQAGGVWCGVDLLAVSGALVDCGCDNVGWVGDVRGVGCVLHAVARERESPRVLLLIESGAGRDTARDYGEDVVTEVGDAAHVVGIEVVDALCTRRERESW